MGLGKGLLLWLIGIPIPVIIIIALLMHHRALRAGFGSVNGPKPRFPFRSW